MIEAFDSEVLISAASAGPRTEVSRRVLAASESRIGSVLLLPEVLSKPIRGRAEAEVGVLVEILAGIDLKPVDEEVADASVAFGAKYSLRAADAIHLATAVVWGAQRFHTNNRRDFGPHIEEIEIAWPEG
jgi:predicted nucleic acid-binding protein